MNEKLNPLAVDEECEHLANVEFVKKALFRALKIPSEHQGYEER